MARPLAAAMVARRRRWQQHPGPTQARLLSQLLAAARSTAFGKDHHFSDVRDAADLRQAVPIRDYEGLRPYLDRVVAGEPDVLWPGQPLYLAKTSGTTSGVKYIPISRQSIPYHIAGARDALLSYVHETGHSAFLDKKLIFLTGSPELSQQHGMHVGRLSGISNHHVPAYLKKNQVPSWATNCIDDWETKLDAVIDETLGQPLSLISGIPPWVQMYFDRIQERTGQKIKDVFPDFELLVYGGVNFEPYRARLFDTIGRAVPSVETFPASEGFFAYQDSQTEPGLLLLLQQGMFYEFIPADQFSQPDPPRLSIDEVKLGVNYALILHTNAGLWGYNLGDTVRFVSLHPHRVVVTGRLKHFISAFGEHVIAEEVENALRYALEQQPGTQVIEFTVAPQVTPPEGGLPYHEWFVEFGVPPADPAAFAAALDAHMVALNVYYKDLIRGSILRPLVLHALPPGAFAAYMKRQGKLGGQNKVPRLTNDRTLAEGLGRSVNA